MTNRTANLKPDHDTKCPFCNRPVGNPEQTAVSFTIDEKCGCDVYTCPGCARRFWRRNEGGSMFTDTHPFEGGCGRILIIESM